MYLQSITGKVFITIEFSIFEYVLVPNFTLKKYFCIFAPHLPEKVFLVKSQKNKHFNWILQIETCLDAKFELKKAYLIFLELICPKRVFSAYDIKSEYHHWIMHIHIRVLDSKFQLKLRTFLFGIKIDQKGHLQSKTKIVNFTIEFFILIPDLTDNFEFFLTKFAKKYFLSIKGKKIAIKFWLLEVV